MELNWGILAAIFIINVVYVSLSTVRLMLTMKGYQSVAPFVAMIEVAIYVVGLGLVLDNLDNVFNVIVYAVGFGAGIYAGMKIEDKLALGYILVTTIVPENGWYVAEEIRGNGYGVTISQAYGREGNRFVLEILTPRSNERGLYKLIHEIEPKAFVISYEPKYINGGFWTKRMKNNKAQVKNNPQESPLVEE
ncbi:DUF2179 domain-containing protein [Alkalibacterium thalassium]|uniref:UPF0316 protein SAMN04488098_104415 n=1 Tax=Alkalibacterium thalassium TaxID=426701 RepID=A0A1G9DF27_9LACT|nr:DUF2179 domain-containing protein [Alkalibacterium thalassium]SDK62491.1 Uncharacterized protein YebE, UPF0316 family [Alkalibacterium thalassium]